MTIEYQGDLTIGNDDQFAIVVARYNTSITEKLLSGAVETLQKQGAEDSQIHVVRVPGAWELSVAAKKLADSKKFSAILCLGAVIRGETTHDLYINQQVSHSLGSLSLEYGLPISFGLLTCNNMEQAIHRSGGNVGNKGIECAEAALEMVNLFKKI